MSLYRMKVCDYTYDIEHLKSTRIRSPNLNLQDGRSPLIALILQGNNQDSARLISDVSAVRDDIREHPYLAEAHGVIVYPNDDFTTHPIWAIQRETGLKSPYPIDIVDLVNYQETRPSACNVCWVPHLELSDGLTVTLLSGLPTNSRKNKRKIVVIQRIGFPRETRLEYKDVERLRALRRIEEPQKGSIFHDQLKALHSMLDLRGEPPPSASGSFDLNQLRSMVHENLKMARTFANRHLRDQSVDGSTSCARSDYNVGSKAASTSGESLDNEPCRMPALATPCFCCAYPKLAPTRKNLRPRHWHKQDDECAIGSAHPRHCVYAEAYPTECVVSGVPHTCCPALTPTSSISTTDTADSIQGNINNCIGMAGGLTLESPSRGSEGLGSPWLPIDTEESDIFDDLPPLNSNLEETWASDPGASCAQDLSSLDAGSPWPATDADVHNHADRPEPELMAVEGDNEDGVDGGRGEYFNLQTSITEQTWRPEVHLDALPSTPQPQDLLF